MAVAKSGVLEAGKPVRVTVDIDPFGVSSGYSVINRAPEGVIWVRTDGRDAEPEADDNFPVIGARTFESRDGDTTVTISLVSDVDAEYTVEGRS